MTIDLNRYARQVSLREIGPEGTRKLHMSSLLCIGAGGLGCPLLQYLCCSGIGRIGIVDADSVELSNLPRQILFTESDVGSPKVSAAAARLSLMNSNTEFKVYPERFADTSEWLEVAQQYDLIVDCTDSRESRKAINMVALKAGKLMVHAALHGFDLQLATLCGRQSSCYECFNHTDAAVPSCSEHGILGAVCGIAGSLQALECLRILAGRPIDETLIGELMILDTASFSIRSMNLRRKPGCVCSGFQGADYEFREKLEGEVLEITFPEFRRLFPSCANPLIVDIRNPSEWKGDRIPEALNVPYERAITSEGAVEIAGLKEAGAVLIYCGSGIKSKTLGRMLRAKGYTRVFSLLGGFVKWKQTDETG